MGERACNTFSCVQVLFDLDKTKTSALSVAPKYKSIRIYIEEGNFSTLTLDFVSPPPLLEIPPVGGDRQIGLI